MSRLFGKNAYFLHEKKQILLELQSTLPKTVSAALLVKHPKIGFGALPDEFEFCCTRGIGNDRHTP